MGVPAAGAAGATGATGTGEDISQYRDEVAKANAEKNANDLQTIIMQKKQSSIQLLLSKA